MPGKVNYLHMEKKKTFLSYNSRDKPFVEQVARWLEDEAKIPVWLDKWNLIPGDPWQEDIEKALDESQCCVVFISPEGIGPWQNEEMRSAIASRVSAKSIRVVPVLLPGVKRPGKESQLPRFLRGLTWVEFKDKLDEPGALYRLECGIKGKEPGRDYGEIETGICPYRGLEIFREQDRRFFFGREVLEEQLLDKLADSRFLAVAGPSGSGKSSLVQAGLISSLRPHSQVALFTPGEQPLEELAFALRSFYPPQEKPPLEQLLKRLLEDGNTLHYIARELLEFSPQKKLLVVIDQFEELFTQTASEEMRRRFISLLLEAVQVVNGPVTVILTIRSDFIGKCAFYKELNMFVIDHLVQVEPMGMEELRRAIEKPAHMVGLHFEAGLVNRILEDVKGAPGELPLLEHALLELYDRRDGGCLSLSAYDEVGGIAGALVNRAETEFNKLDDTEKDILRKMFVLRLIQPGEGTEDTRRRATKEELLSIGSTLNKKFFRGPGGGFTKKPPGRRRQVKEILNRWIDSRLLTATRDSSGGLVLVDVAHEALIRKWHKIREWMAEGRESARLTGILRQAVSEWLGKNSDPDFLFQGARLVQMEGLVETHSSDLTDDEIEFVKTGAAMRAAKERKELLAAQELAVARARELNITRDLSAAKSKTIKRTRMIIAVIFLSLMAVTYLFYNSDKNEKKARQQLAVNHWENSRQAREGGRQIYSLHLLAEAVAVNPDPVFRDILLFDMIEFWNDNPLQHIFRHDGAVNKAKFNAKATRILTCSDDGTARLWHAETGKPIGQEMVHNGRVNGAIFSADETRILTYSYDGTARLWHPETGKPIGQEMVHEKVIWGATFNADGTKILTYSYYNARLWDAENGKPIGQEMVHNGRVNGATFNADDTRILTYSDDGTARLWHPDTCKPIGQEMVHDEAVIGATFNADETRILTWSGHSSIGIGTARLWHAETGKPIGREMVHDEAVIGATFNTDETRILTWTRYPLRGGGTARLWHTETGKPIGQEMVHEYLIGGATFNADETRILTWSKDATAKVWDIGVDWDYPDDKIKFQIMALTSTKFNTTTMEIELIEPDEWRKIKKEYMEFAAEHYKTCKYPQANVFRKLFPEEAKELKRTVIGH